MPRILVFWFLGLVLPLWSQAVPVDRIEITSSWVGLIQSNGPFKFHALITRKGAGYYRADGAKVDPDSIKALWAAIQAPPVHAVELPTFGLTEPWLAGNAERMVDAYAKRFNLQPTPSQKHFLVGAIKDLKQVQTQLPGLFSGAWTDDYPLVRIQLTSKGKRISLETNSQYQFMVPWELKGSDAPKQTFNVDISRAVAALMVRKDTNRQRLSGADFETDLVHKLREVLETEWNRLEVVDKAPGVLERLQERFEVVSAQFTDGRSLDGGIRLDGACLNCVLHPAKSPERFSISVTFPRKDGRVEQVEEYLRGVDRYLDLVRSVPWLSAHLATPSKEIDPSKIFPPTQSETLKVLRQRLVDRAERDPAYKKRWRLMRAGEMVRLCLSEDRSLSNRALNLFKEDMRNLGRDDLAQMVENRAPEVALLNVGWDGWGCYLLVLPDRTSILWRWKSRAQFGWNLANFSHQERENGWECSAVRISPEGTLLESDACGRFPDRGFDGPDMRSFQGSYTNPNYGFSVTIPPGLVGHDSPAPMPHHGFGIVLSWEPRAYAWTNGEYNAQGWQSVHEATLQVLAWNRETVGKILSSEVIPMTIGGRVGERLILRYECNENQTRRVLHEVVFMREHSIGTLYQVGLDTTESREGDDLKVFDQLTSSWQFVAVD